MAEAGRPTAYKEQYCDDAVELIGNQGRSVTQFARDIGVSKSTVYLWAQTHPAFSDALDLARDWSEAFWEDQFISFMTDKAVNAPLVKLYFANRFRWHDRAEQEDGDESEAPSLSLHFDVKPAAADVRVTRGKSRA